MIKNLLESCWSCSNEFNKLLWILLLSPISEDSRSLFVQLCELIPGIGLIPSILGTELPLYYIMNEMITVKAFVVTPSWNVRNFGHLCFFMMIFIAQFI